MRKAGLPPCIDRWGVCTFTLLSRSGAYNGGIKRAGLLHDIGKAMNHEWKNASQEAIHPNDYGKAGSGYGGIPTTMILRHLNAYHRARG